MKIASGVGCPAFPKIRGKMENIKYPCYAEVKIDGEANVYYNGSLTSKASGKVRRDFPVVEELKGIPQDTMLLGELYWGDGKAGELYDFLSHQKDHALKFCIFDVAHPTLGEADYETRREWCIQHIYPKLPIDGHITVVRPMYVENYHTLRDMIANNKADGYEGLVIKNRDSLLFSKTGMITTQLGWVKVKHIHTGDYAITQIDPQLERMEVDVNGRMVGVKCVNKYKPLVKVGSIVEIEHMGVLSGGGLRHPVFRGKVVR